MYGVRCPQNINDAYKEDLAYDASAELSRAMGHLRWRDAINKEIDKLFEYDCFTITDAVTPDMIYHQQCRYSWVFTVKPGGRELKARLVARGDTVDTEGVASYFSVVENSSTKIAMTAAHRDGQLTCTADVSNAYIGAPARELIYMKAGKEFGEEREGKILRVHKALYGLVSSGRSYFQHNSSILRSLGWVPTTGDCNVWIKKDVGGKLWSRLVCYVDDFQLHSVAPHVYMEELSKRINFKFQTLNVDRYLGNDIKQQEDGTTVLTSETYIREVLQKIAGEHSRASGGNTKGGAGFHKQSIPPFSIKLNNEGLPARQGTMPHPREDDAPWMTSTPLLDDLGKRYYQVLCGSLQWCCSLGRYDMVYSTSVLARYASCPQVHHMDRLLNAWGYLRKNPRRGIRINSDDPLNLPEFDPAIAKNLRHDHYPSAKEELAPSDPVGMGRALKLSIFCDSDWAGNELDRCSRTGLLLFCGSTPILAKSQKQGGVQTSSYGAELSALKSATETVTGMRQLCRSFGIPIEGSSPTYGDNLGVLTSIANSTTLLRKKQHGIAWHYIRTAVAAGIISPRKVWSEQNPSDLMTKAVSKATFDSLVNSFMTRF